LNNLARDIIKNILVYEPESRFELEDIKNHKFFKAINWQKVKSR